MIREAELGEVDFTAMRAAMVASQLRTSDVNDPAVIAAMSEVPREDFVPPARKTSAYVDRPIALADGNALNPPLATGRLLTAAAIRPGDKVLLVGDVTGYTASLLAHMGAAVTALGEGERPSGLPKSVQWVKGPVAKGASTAAPYDAIVIDGAIPEFPASLAVQLAEGGRVATGIDEGGVTRLCSGKKAGGVLGFQRLGDIEMVAVPGFVAKSAEFVF